MFSVRLATECESEVVPARSARTTATTHHVGHTPRPIHSRAKAAMPVKHDDPDACGGPGTRRICLRIGHVAPGSPAHHGRFLRLRLLTWFACITNCSNQKSAVHDRGWRCVRLTGPRRADHTLDHRHCVVSGESSWRCVPRCHRTMKSVTATAVRVCRSSSRSKPRKIATKLRQPEPCGASLVRHRHRHPQSNAVSDERGDLRTQ